jgi:hypothetical protein
MGLSLLTKTRSQSDPLSNQNYLLFVVCVTVMVAVVTILGLTPHYCYDCSSFAIRWVFTNGSTITNM